MPVLVSCKFDGDPIKNEGAQYCVHNIFSIISLWENIGFQGQATPKLIVRSGPKSNSSEILCLSWLPESLKKIR